MFEIVRKVLSDNTSIGDVLCDDVWIAKSLEDKTREGPKVPKATAIPCGTYELTIDFSQRFKKLMPHILNVRDFSGVRVHKGNDSEDTEGCPLVGLRSGPDKIWDCQPAYDRFYNLLDTKLKAGEKVFIKVSIAEDVQDLRNSKG
jgi:hypothetical protein